MFVYRVFFEYLVFEQNPAHDELWVFQAVVDRVFPISRQGKRGFDQFGMTNLSEEESFSI